MKAARGIRGRDASSAAPSSSSVASSARSNGSVSAPPARASSNPRLRVNMPGNAPVADQMAAILVARERSNDVVANIAALQRKSGAQKHESQHRQHKEQWLRERAALAKERKSADTALIAALKDAAPHFEKTSISEPMSSSNAAGVDIVAADESLRGYTVDDGPHWLRYETNWRESDADRATTEDEACTVLGNLLALYKQTLGLTDGREGALPKGATRESVAADVQQSIEQAKGFLSTEGATVSRTHDMLAKAAEKHEEEQTRWASRRAEVRAAAAADPSSGEAQVPIANSMPTFLTQATRHVDVDAATIAQSTTTAATVKSVERNLKALETFTDDALQRIAARYPRTDEELRGLFAGATIEKLVACRDAVDTYTVPVTAAEAGPTDDDHPSGSTVEGATPLSVAAVAPSDVGTRRGSSTVTGIVLPGGAVRGTQTVSALSGVTVGTTQVLSADEVERIAVLAREYSGTRHEALGGGKARAALVERIKFEMPHLKDASIRQHVDRLETTQRGPRRAAAVVRDTAAAIRDLLTHFESIAAVQEDAQKAAEEEAARLAELAADRDARHAELEKLRAAHDEAAAAKLEAQLEEAAAKAAQQAVVDAKMEKERQERMKALVAYQEAKAELAAKEEESRLQAAMLKAAEDERTASHNAQRVAVRQQETEQRIADAKLQKLLLEEEVQRKAELVEQFKDRMEAHYGVEADADRARQATVASDAAREEARYIPAQEHARHQHASVHGYTDKQIFKDPNFRVHNALVAAGLHKTAYARGLLMGGGLGNNARAATNATSAAHPFSRPAQ